MRSSSGEHYEGLDHVRALAAFMVFCWHFLHGLEGSPLPSIYVPAIPLLAPFEEGHTGVALFMVLSGYIFAKILNGKSINYGSFIYARALRLLPLLVLVIFIEGVRIFLFGGSLRLYAHAVAQGFYLPTLPYGGWSITTEWHFYLILPLLLALGRRSTFLLPALIVVALVFRALLYLEGADMRWWSYLTIVGRFDQFALGMIAFTFRQRYAGRHIVAAAFALVFCVYYWAFDFSGGYQYSEQYVWIWLPTIEGYFYGVLIAWYDISFSPRGRLSKAISMIGQSSYSMYSLHFFFVFWMSRWFSAYILPINSMGPGMLGAAVCFLCLCPLAIASYYIVEKPFLKLRKPYVRDKRKAAHGHGPNVGNGPLGTV